MGIKKQSRRVGWAEQERVGMGHELEVVEIPERVHKLGVVSEYFDL